MNAKAFVIPAIFKAIDDFSRPIKVMQRNMSNFERQMHTMKSGLDRVYRGLGGNYATIGAGIGLYGIASGFKEIVKQAGQAEQTIASFTPMLGNAEKATELFKMLQKTAATTPFEFGDLSKATNWLLPITKGNLSETIKLLRMLGDTAGGNPEALNEIARNYSQILGKGKADMVDIKQFATYGIQVWENLSKSTGFSIKQLHQMQGEGKISGAMITKMFVDMTSAGGNYFNAMEIANRTLFGQWSNLKDNIKMAAAEVGLTFLPILKDYLKEAIGITKSVKEWAIANKEIIGMRIAGYLRSIASAARFVIENFDTIVTVLKYYVSALIFTKAAMLALGIVTNTVALATGFWKGMMIASKGVLLATEAAIWLVVTAQKAWNLVSLTTIAWLPAIAALIIGLVAIVSKLTSGWTRLTQEQEALNELSERTASTMGYQKTEAQQLFKALKNNAVISKEYQEALKKIEEIQPGITQKYKLYSNQLWDIVNAEKELLFNMKARHDFENAISLGKERNLQAQIREAGGPSFMDWTKGILTYGLDDIIKGVGVRDLANKYKMRGASELYGESETFYNLSAKKQQTMNEGYKPLQGGIIEILNRTDNNIKSNNKNFKITDLMTPKVEPTMGF